MSQHSYYSHLSFQICFNCVYILCIAFIIILFYFILLSLTIYNNNSSSTSAVAGSPSLPMILLRRALQHSLDFSKAPPGL